MPLPISPDQFWARHIVSKTGCWEWTCALHKDGYGSLRFHNAHWLAHRLAWTLKHGAIPTGLCVCHTCDNPKCINPDHLFLGSHRVNMGDMRIKGRRKRINDGARNGRARLSEANVIAIRKKYKRGETRQVDLADEFGVNQSTISQIVLNKIWQDAR